jgi:type I restriction enzyme S subunit
MAKWRKVKLADVCKFVRGPFGGSLKKDIFVSQGYAVFEQQHAICGDFNKFRYFVTKDKFNEMQRFKLSPGDLIMSCSGTLGKVALVPEGIPNGIINQALLKLTPTDEVEGSYMKSWFESDLFTQSLRQNSGGAAIQNVAEVRLLKEIEIPLPPLAEQRKIAEILRTWDEAIETAEDELKAKQERKRWLVRRVMGGFSDRKSVSQFGNLKKGGAILREKLRSEGVPVVLYGDIYTKYGEIVTKLISRVDASAVVDGVKLNSGDIVFAGSGETAEEIGKCIAYVGEEAAYAGGDVVILSNHGQDPRYLGYALNSEEAIRQKMRLGQGSSVMHLYKDDVASIKIPLPPISDQRKVGEILTETDTDIELINQRINVLRIQKRGLMQKLLTGEIRVAA